MSRRSFAISSVLSIFALGIPLTGCSNLLADAHYNIAIEKYDEGDYEATIKLLDSAIEINEKYEYYYNRGVANLELENHEEALKDFNKSIDINPEFSSAYINRALIRLKMADADGV